LWEGDGLAVYYKRLEKGAYEVPSINNGDNDLSIDMAEDNQIIASHKSQEIYA
jgi:IS66 Orf2 like protein